MESGACPQSSTFHSDNPLLSLERSFELWCAFLNRRLMAPRRTVLASRSPGSAAATAARCLGLLCPLTLSSELAQVPSHPLQSCCSALPAGPSPRSPARKEITSPGEATCALAVLTGPFHFHMPSALWDFRRGPSAWKLLLASFPSG